jgi:hypothetical protein
MKAGSRQGNAKSGLANRLMKNLRSSQSPSNTNSVSVKGHNIRGSIESVASVSGLSGTGGSASNTQGNVTQENIQN